MTCGEEAWNETAGMPGDQPSVRDLAERIREHVERLCASVMRKLGLTVAELPFDVPEVAARAAGLVTHTRA
jgi:hypothetical protein